MLDDKSMLRRITKWLFTLACLILLGSGGVWVYNSPYFPIREIRIDDDLQRVSTKELQTIAQQYIQGNILRANLNDAQKAFQALAWVDEAKVRRRLPDVVEVKIIERQLIARWENEGLIDSKGNFFQANTAESLPIFSGEIKATKTMVEHYHEFMKVLAPLHLTINHLECSPRLAWEITLNNGIIVRLGREDEIVRLNRFAQAWPLILDAQKNQLEYVDMRYKDGFAVRYHQVNELDTSKATE